MSLPPRPLCFTIRSPKGRFRELRTECYVSKAFSPATTPPGQNPPFSQFEAIWDTGATGSVITSKVVKALGLKPIGMSKVSTAAGQTIQPVFLVNLGLPNGLGLPNVRVTMANLGGGVDVLIGMDVITTGDFSVSNKDGRTVFSFRFPSLHIVDFVREHSGWFAALRDKFRW